MPPIGEVRGPRLCAALLLEPGLSGSDFTPALARRSLPLNNKSGRTARSNKGYRYRYSYKRLHRTAFFLG